MIQQFSLLSIELFAKMNHLLAYLFLKVRYNLNINTMVFTFIIN